MSNALPYTTCPPVKKKSFDEKIHRSNLCVEICIRTQMIIVINYSNLLIYNVIRHVNVFKHFT